MATKNIIHVSGASNADTSRLQMFEETATESGGTILKTLRKIWDSLNFAPATNIAKTALASDVQTSLGKADTAVQPATLASAVLYSNGDVTPVDGAVALETNGVKRLAFAANAADEVTLVLPTPTIDGTTLDFMLDVYNPALVDTSDWYAEAPYSSSASYDVGDKATLDGKAYECNTAIPVGGEEWNPDHWNFVAYVRHEYSSSSEYAVGDVVEHDGKLYECTSRIEAGGEAWNADHWALRPKLTIDGLDNTISVVVPEGETLTDWCVIAPGEMSEFYFTLTAFKVNGLPTWKVVKQLVENGGAQS
jgi:hypothetical protein